MKLILFSTLCTIPLVYTGVFEAFTHHAGSTAVISRHSVNECVVGDRWVANFIVFECYSALPDVVKGVKPIACSTLKTKQSDVLIEIGSQYEDKNFISECVKVTDDLLKYKAIKCKADDGTQIDIDQSYTDDKGLKWHCKMNDMGAMVTYEGEKDSCHLADGSSLAHGERRTKQSNTDANLKGTVIECAYQGDDKWQEQVIGCELSKGGVILIDQADRIGNEFYVCLPGDVGFAKLDKIEQECDFNGEKHKINDEWKNKDGTLKYTCRYDKFTKTIRVRVVACMDKINIQKGVEHTIYANNFLIAGNSKFYQCRIGDGKGPLEFEIIIMTYEDLPSCGVHQGIDRKVPEMDPELKTWIEDVYAMQCVWFAYGGSDHFSAEVKKRGCKIPDDSLEDPGAIVFPGRDGIIKQKNDTHSYVCFIGAYSGGNAALNLITTKQAQSGKYEIEGGQGLGDKTKEECKDKHENCSPLGKYCNESQFEDGCKPDQSLVTFLIEFCKKTCNKC